MAAFSEKVVVITGSGRGFGAAAARAFASRGANIVINDIVIYEETGRLARQIEALGRKVLVLKADVSDRTQVKDLFKKTYDTFGHIDVLVNNAGISRMKEFLQMRDEDWDVVLNVNLKSMFITTQEIFPYFMVTTYPPLQNLSKASRKCKPEFFRDFS